MRREELQVAYFGDAEPAGNFIPDPAPCGRRPKPSIKSSIKHLAIGTAAVAVILSSPTPLAGASAGVPEVLPRHDTSSPSAGKIQVYILAGQSNMVGFGYLQGSPGYRL